MTGCVDCGASTPNTRCEVCRVGHDRDLSSECPDCGDEVFLVVYCDDCSDTAQAAREGAGTIITGPDASDVYVIGGGD